VSSKECKICSEDKPLSEFYKKKDGKLGRDAICTPCRKGRYKTHKPTAESKRLYEVKTKYGLSPEEYKDLIEDSNNSCSICGISPDNLEKKWLCVDHDHVTGKVRGLLCNKCNSAIGLLDDNPTLLTNAIKYLKEHS